MRKIIISEHVTLDGFLAGPNGEMDWIKVDEEMFNLVGELTNDADVAMYGRVTYEMMNGYWPTAGQEPDASKHDIEHSAWYNRVHKIVLSTTMSGLETDKTTFIGKNVEEEIKKLKSQEGKNILIFGSPSVVRMLIENNLIDEYWLFINPVILGTGIPLFPGLEKHINLTFVSSHTFTTGVTGVHYRLL